MLNANHRNFDKMHYLQPFFFSCRLKVFANRLLVATVRDVANHTAIYFVIYGGVIQPENRHRIVTTESVQMITNATKI